MPVPDLSHDNSSSTPVVLLAGGFGTRVSHLLPNLPKPMAPVAGRPFLEWIIRYFHTLGFSRFVLSTGHLAAVIEDHFAGHAVAGVEIYCRRETSPLGTAGGFLNAIADRPPTGGGWLAANGDSLVAADAGLLVRRAKENRWDAALLGLELPDASRFGSLTVGADGTLARFAEKRPGAGTINAGVYWFSDDCLRRFPSAQPLSFELDVFPALIASGRKIGVVPVAAPFIDIGTPASLAEANDYINRNIKKLL
jgi:D-glycero-alpha-D-manno-heptose 1-phosphate guanylyltransferase